MVSTSRPERSPSESVKPGPRKLRADFDVVLVGAGLQNALIACALKAHRAELRLLMIDQGNSVGGNHTWCFHAGDLSRVAAAFTAPLIVKRWPGYTVQFRGHTQSLDQPYALVSSERLSRVVTELFARDARSTLLLGTKVREVDARSVSLDDARTFSAELVVDARGPGALLHQRPLAFQKFVGLQVELSSDFPSERPILMDATVPQTDGFRFFYVLPLTQREVLVEDTYFSDDSALDEERLKLEIRSYVEARGHSIVGVVRQERGVLPLPLYATPKATHTGALTAGYAGNFFHPTTGYSFPVAARLAEFLAREGIEAFGTQRFRKFVASHQRQFRYALWLNRLLFGAFAPEDRHHVLERFYKLPADTIRRFYALDTTHWDRARILCGRPPRGFSLQLALSRGAQLQSVMPKGATP